jgi:hypothetical protein
MKYGKFVNLFNEMKFIIEEDNPDVGFYLYVYQDGRCINDYLQNDLKTAKQFAFDKYNVPVDEWKEIN